MNRLGKPERATQNRVIALFRDALGYTYLGDWSERENHNVEESLLRDWLARQGHGTAQINRALDVLGHELGHTGRTLYENNRAVYQRLRYPIPVKTEAGNVTESVFLIDWEHPEANDFAIAEEVTLKGGLERRPDLVLYVNGIAIAVIELKRSSVSIGEGIRQLLSNQQREFNADFFSSVQLVFAGNDTQGLKYATVGTPEKMFLKWKEDESEDRGYPLDKYLAKLCRKDRLIELMHDFVLFDGGIKKVPRVHQYFAIRAAQEHVRRRQGGIIWHAQGSGKSIVMVLLAKWILENYPHARVLVVTDRDELDKQIEKVFRGSDEQPYRTSSGRDLMQQLAKARPRLLCSLVHKFGVRGVDDFDAFTQEIESQPHRAYGELFVFVDECHRTQSGKLHRAMKAQLPNAVFIGFTGTPLLKQDKATSFEVFGSYIHTYVFKEAVADGVVLDLAYEARDVDQQLGSQDKIDQWFEAKTRGLNDWQKDELKKTWGTLQRVLSSRSRKERVVADIEFDFTTRPRLASERGNAMLVMPTILDACQYFRLFQQTPLKGRCAIVTSYNPQTRDVTKEETGANSETDRQFIYKTYTDLLKDVVAKPGQTKAETYEDRVRGQFVEEPANMRLLIVVDKLLTGFDAQACTYLYIDKSMQDHALFQAICRTNRLDGDDKPFGYIVDYKDLFKKLVNAQGTGALQVYSSELDRSVANADPEIVMQNRLEAGRAKLDEALEQLARVCEPVPPPRAELDYLHYFCGNSEIATDLKEREPRRVALYKTAAALLRAYANLADDLTGAGYAPAEIAGIKRDVQHYTQLRDSIRLASGELLDLKPYEADMRHLIDTYVEASAARPISAFADKGLLEVVASSGLDAAIAALPEEIRRNKNATAEVIENNVRAKIIQEQLNDPAFFVKMSQLLDEVIKLRKEHADRYAEYLQRIAALLAQVRTGQAADTPEELQHRPGVRAIYNNLTAAGPANLAADAALDHAKLKLAKAIEEAVLKNRPADWRGNLPKENAIKFALLPLLDGNQNEVERIFRIIKQRQEY
ncbi:MAG: type I restriction endonuclease subunit R [Gammaproteobacteria bacterium]